VRLGSRPAARPSGRATAVGRRHCDHHPEPRAFPQDSPPSDSNPRSRGYHGRVQGFTSADESSRPGKNANVLERSERAACPMTADAKLVDRNGRKLGCAMTRITSAPEDARGWAVAGRSVRGDPSPRARLRRVRKVINEFDGGFDRPRPRLASACRRGACADRASGASDTPSPLKSARGRYGPRPGPLRVRPVPASSPRLCGPTHVGPQTSAAAKLRPSRPIELLTALKSQIRTREARPRGSGHRS
jgi:hypothetical protein